MKVVLWVLLALSALLAGCGGGSAGTSSGAIDPGTPPVVGTPHFVHYGYFFSGLQLEEVVDHASIGFELAVFNDINLSQHLALMRANNMKAMLEVGYVYTNKHFTGVDRLRTLLTRLRTEGTLDLIVSFYPVDEPDLFGWSENDVVAANDAIHALCKEFPELGGCAIAVIYSDHRQVGHESYDWLGSDGGNYGGGPILVELMPGQKMILVPGGADPWREDPAAFVKFASGNPDVALVMPFLWVDHYGGTPYLGIGNNGMAAKYKAAALELQLRPPAVPK